ncbi:MAG: hypothetical protein IPK50_10780 [Fibrobacterota bacterium]|nr:MAG: hypothetical protein IPK50_10780 [Fibrobacterota bacterium]
MKLFPALAAFGMLLPNLAASSTLSVVMPDTILIKAPPADIIARPVAQPKIEFAVINTPDADYLQTEFSSLSTGIGVRIDSVSIQVLDTNRGTVRSNLEVHWRWATGSKDSVFPLSRRVQFLDPLQTPYALAPMYKSRSAIRVDTVWTCQNGRCMIAPTPKVVANYTSASIYCTGGCLSQDSLSIVREIRDRIEATGVALALHPLQASILPIRSAWMQTTGDEEIANLSAKLSGNVANWISQDVFRFEVSPIAYTTASKPNIPRSLDYKTGPAQYAYNRTASPNLKILEDQDVRVVGDTLVKFGKSLYLQRSPLQRCGFPTNDSLVGRDSWFVVPDSTGGADAIEQALLPVMCGLRSSAWRMSGDTVWLGKTKWPILLQDLLRISSIDGKLLKVPSGDAPRLVGSRLELAWGATVVARDLSGRRLGSSSALTAGSHELDLAGHRGAFVLEIRSLDGKGSSSLRGSAFAR